MNKIQLLIDNPNSWMVPYSLIYSQKLNSKGYSCTVIFSHEDVKNGDIIILISCEKKFTQFSKNKYNLVIHESNLPKGKGWSPMTYQVLEGKKKIPITLFEANESFDGGKVYLRDFIKLNGGELVYEIREKQANISFKLIDKFLIENKKMIGIKQSGEESFYKKRTESDRELNIYKSILENFNLLRVSDNESYPAYFIINGQKYLLKITKDG